MITKEHLHLGATLYASVSCNRLLLTRGKPYKIFDRGSYFFFVINDMGNILSIEDSKAQTYFEFKPLVTQTPINIAPEIKKSGTIDQYPISVVYQDSEAKKASMSNLLESEAKRWEWSQKTFTEATAESSLQKARQEIEEIQQNITNGIKDPEEYADVIMCLFDSAQRDGITVQDIIEAYSKKVEKNILREWKHNEDGTYSHVKKEEE